MRKLKVFLLLGVFGISMAAKAARFTNDWKSGDFYVTNTDECHKHGDPRAPKPFYKGIYLNELNIPYDPNTSRRANVWLDSCDNEAQYDALKGKRIYVQLSPSHYSPGHWDPDINNNILPTCQRCAQGSSGIQFEKKSLETIQITDVSSIQFPYAKPGLLGFTQIGFSYFPRLILKESVGNEAECYAQVIGANGDGFRQSLSAGEVAKLTTLMQNARATCPLELTIDQSKKQIVQARLGCR